MDFPADRFIQGISISVGGTPIDEIGYVRHEYPPMKPPKPKGWYCEDCDHYYEEQVEKCTQIVLTVDKDKVIKFFGDSVKDLSYDNLCDQVDEFLANCGNSDDFDDEFYTEGLCNSTDFKFEKG